LTSSGRAGPSPFDQRRARPVRRVAIAIVAVAVAAVVATAWFDRSEVRRLELGPAGEVVVENRAGPVEVVERDGPVTVELAVSYLATGPSVEGRADGERATVTVSCPGWGPCRVAAVVAVPPGTTVEVASGADPVTVGGFTGPLRIVTDEGPVALGPVSGPVRISSRTGPVDATGLRSPEVDIEADAAPVAVAFGRLPRHVAISAGTGPVLVTLPSTVYRLDLDGQPVDAGGLTSSPAASRSVSVRSGGPVSLTTVPIRR
jgi:hypothetical protein